MVFAWPSAASRWRRSGSTGRQRPPLTESADPDQLIERRVPVEGATEREIASADLTGTDVGPEDETARSVALHPDERNLRQSQERADNRKLTRQHDRRRIGRIAVLEQQGHRAGSPV